MNTHVDAFLEVLRSVDAESFEDGLFFAFLTFIPIICFQQLLSPFLSISEKWILTIFYFIVAFRRLNKLLDEWFEKAKP